MVSIFKVICCAVNISAHVLTLGSNPKDSALFDNYLSPIQVRLQCQDISLPIIPIVSDET